jgi:hypothetical protein
MRWNDNPDEIGNKVHLIHPGGTYAPNILHRRQTGSAVMLLMERMRKIFFEESDGNEEIKSVSRVGQILRLPQTQRLVLEGSNLLLCEDTCARDLALQHNADVILTEAVLEHLLKEANWILLFYVNN